MQAPTFHPSFVRGRVIGGHEVRDAVRRHRLLSYLLVAYALSWSYWLAMAFSGLVVTPGGTTSHVPGLFGPMISALLVTAIAEGGSGVRELAGRMARWRTGLRWYAFALAPFGFFLVGVAVAGVTGSTIPTLADLGRYSGLPEVGLPAVLALAFVANGFGEEVGWRGFAQPTLRRSHGFLSASLGVAAVWALWHMASFPIIETYRLMGVGVVPVFVVGLGSGALVFGWLYERSGGSILIVALAHLALNMGSATAASRGVPQMVVTTGIIVWAILIVAGEVRRAGGMQRVLGKLGRGIMVRLLRSPIGHGLERTITVISYRGRSSGRRLETPVEYVGSGSRITILVANPEQKQWWRNVQADSHVTLWIKGAEQSGTAAVLNGPEAAQALAAYVAARPRAAVAAKAGAMVIGVELSDAAI